MGQGPEEAIGTGYAQASIPRDRCLWEDTIVRKVAVCAIQVLPQKEDILDVISAQLSHPSTLGLQMRMKPFQVPGSGNPAGPRHSTSVVSSRLQIVQGTNQALGL